MFYFLNWIFLVPSGILTLEERCDVMYMIGGAEPDGEPISTITSPRQRMFA